MNEINAISVDVKNNTTNSNNTNFDSIKDLFNNTENFDSIKDLFNNTENSDPIKDLFFNQQKNKTSL